MKTKELSIGGGTKSEEDWGFTVNNEVIGPRDETWVVSNGFTGV